MKIPTQISPRTAVILAILVLWLLGALGLGIVMHFAGNFWFWPDTSLTLTFRMMGSFYLVRLASFLCSVCIATFLIYLGRFSRPHMAVMATVGGFHLLSFILRWGLHPPKWNTSAQVGAALFFECLSVVLLAGFGVLILRTCLWLDERKGNKQRMAIMTVQSTTTRADGAAGRD